MVPGGLLVSSYFDPLRVRYLVEGLTGLSALRALRRHRAVAGARRGPTGRSRTAWLALSAAANLALAAALLAIGAPAAAAAWLIGLLAFLPFFVSLRQLLEHRSEGADPEVDYTLVDHGAANRLFGDGPLASTLGGAGFNRHALHHWEPNVSYTRLREVEEYLLRTPVASRVRSRRTTYADPFLRLLEL